VSAGSLLGFEEFAERYWRWASELIRKVPEDRRRTMKGVALLLAVFYSGFLAWSDEHQAFLAERHDKELAERARDDAVASLNNFKREQETSEVQIDAWTGDQPIYGMLVETKNLVKYKDSFKLMLIVKVEFADVDQLTDQNIEKSIVYTINGGTMDVVHKAEGILRFNAGQQNQVKLYLVLLPNVVMPDDVKELRDVERLGGRILARRGQAVVGGPPVTVR
jgi:hypothetical protein